MNVRRAHVPMFLAGLAVALLGCGKTEPALSGGKPVSYWVDALRAQFRS